MSSHRFQFRRISLGLVGLGIALAGGGMSPFTPTARAQVAPSMLASFAAAAPAAASSAPVGAVELSPTPPNDTQAVSPNILVTFDDSGSMANNYMGDRRPFDGGDWNGPWFCAGVIDARVTDVTNVLSKAMNGVYYNPNVRYIPPVKADGTSFPDADATLAKVPVDGIAINRPRNAKAVTAPAYRNNPNGSVGTDASTIVNGVLTRDRDGNVVTDRRWSCGYGSSPLSDAGGPYYYRYKGPALDVDAYGKPTASAQGLLYDTTNWEAVAVPNSDVTIDGVTVNQWRNFANWYAYYRTRNLMTRTAVSRVFGDLGIATPSGGYGNAFRVAWQNLYTTDTFHLQDDTIISSLLDLNSPACNASAVDPAATSLQAGSTFRTPPNCYRSAFFNWLFEIPATSGTPARASAIRAGEFFKRGEGNLGGTGDLHDPYWDPPQKSGVVEGNELACRQNFHMLVTDGYWNEGEPTKPTPYIDAQTSRTLPDGTAYNVAAAESRVFWDVQGTKYLLSQANIAFNYWATDLRPDLYKPADGKVVAPYVVDTTTGIVPGASSPELEKYFNPRNDPANWPHMVEYMVTLGVPGYLTFSEDADCINANNDLCKLRRGQTNSTGAIGWTRPANNSPPGIDDTWHASVNSRGSYFNAANPKVLVDQLTNILSNISQRTRPPTTGAVNTAVLVQGALGFNTGYSSADWSGVLQAVTVNADGTTATLPVWDAGSILDDPMKTDPSARNILTAAEKSDGNFEKGLDFKTFGNLDAAGQSLLSTKPPSSDTTNDNGQTRLDYLRGDRSKELITFRQRAHLLGAIINSQAVYVSYPSSGYRNTWPVSSPEANAILADAPSCGATTPSTCHSYEYFVKDHLARKPTVYVGANDGMLHAFDASQQDDGSGNVVPTTSAGKELFAYVPRAAYANLGNLTVKDGFKFLPTVDATPVTRDVFFAADSSTPVTTQKGWHTIMVGGLRLGGRGVYALDITDPTAMSSTKVLWEFNADAPDVVASGGNPGGKPANLGFTFGQPNIGRLSNGKWVVLVPGGYFPDCSKAPFTAANCTSPAAASNSFSSLFVLDAQTGQLIREIRTSDSLLSGSVFSHGLASPVLGDYNNDQIDDVAFAGDLDGNLWRFDLSDPSPSNWAVTLAFKPATRGAQPITSMPRLFADPITNRFIVVFGTGKYLGVEDNTSTSAAQQSVYGIRDRGYTVTVSNLVQQTLAEKLADDGKTLARGLTNYEVPSTKDGWYFNLGPSASSAGERVVVTPGALFDTGRAVIQTLIPGTNDPCDASIQGAIMVVNAATGGSAGGLSFPNVTGWGGSSPGAISLVGGRVNDPRTSGSVPLASTLGGGTVLIPGLKLSGGNGMLDINDAIWRRRSWRKIKSQ